MYKLNDVSISEIPLIPSPYNSQYAASKYPQAVGLSKPKARLSRKDLSVMAVQLLCLSLAIVTVFQQQIASYLGQLYQLIVIGFLLAIMASAMEGQSIRVALVYLGYRKNSALQDFDAILRKDLLAPQIGIFLRVILLLLTLLPLGLAVSYKLFVGGNSTITINKGDGIFGYSALPGYQRIGDGLTLIADIYQPFWTDPALNRTYGFNLYIADNDTTLIPDTPYPEFLTLLQSSLASQEYMILTTEVNATVSQLANPTAAERASQAWWDDVYEQFGHMWTTNGGDINGANNGLWAGMGSSSLSWNFSVAYLSVWNTTLNQTFFSEAYRCEQYRQPCNATWKITSSSATLTSVDIIEPDSTHSPSNQSIIQNDWLGVQEMFSNYLGEYDWHNRAGAFEFPYPSPVANGTSVSTSIPKWNLDINTVCPLSASMVWARITSLNGGDRPDRDSDRLQHTMYTKSSSKISLTKIIPTLRRTPLLLLVLAVNPVIALITILLKVVMYRSPIDDGFNAVSLLASTAGSEMGMLKGAALSGELERRVYMRFSTIDADVENDATKAAGRESRQIVGILDQSGKSERLSRGVVYH